MKKESIKQVRLFIKVFNVLILVCSLYILISLWMAYQGRENITWSSLSLIGALASALLIYVCYLIRRALKELLKDVNYK
jgi:uncharacterized membrane protein (Fun14 family)